MEYGKPFGVATAGGVAFFGHMIGYGWIISVSLIITIIGISGIRLFFRRHKPLDIDRQ
ncbi:hypothetical protein JNM87_06095 [Candidatus Saccharibacteria bacterium]|nr:hypothetical protein [Candidatus Saccharibacteria bacterium]